MTPLCHMTTWQNYIYLIVEFRLSFNRRLEVITALRFVVVRGRICTAGRRRQVDVKRFVWIGSGPQRPRLFPSRFQFSPRHYAMVDDAADEVLDVLLVTVRRQHVTVPDPVDVQRGTQRLRAVPGGQRQPALLVAADRPSDGRTGRHQRLVLIDVDEEVQLAATRLD